MSKRNERILTEDIAESPVHRSRRSIIARYILVGVQEVMYVTLIILATVSICTSDADQKIWFDQQARTVIIGATAGAIGIWGTTIIEKLCKVRIGLFVDILIAIDLVFSVVLGEACQVFLNVTGYDKVLHAFGTMELALVGYVLAKFFLAKSNKGGKHQVVFALVFGFFFALGIQMIWELYEFTFDMTSNTNMQKYLPDQFQDFVTVIDGVVQLDPTQVTDEDLVEFYRYFDGYHYAVEDTMYDIVADVVGAALGIIISGVIFHFYPQLQDSLLRDARPQKKPEPETISTQEASTDEKVLQIQGVTDVGTGEQASTTDQTDQR